MDKALIPVLKKQPMITYCIYCLEHMIWGNFAERSLYNAAFWMANNARLVGPHGPEDNPIIEEFTFTIAGHSINWDDNQIEIIEPTEITVRANAEDGWIKEPPPPR